MVRPIEFESGSVRFVPRVPVAKVVRCGATYRFEAHMLKEPRGEIPDTQTGRSGRARSGRAGVKARAEKLSSEKRIQIAKKAAGVRWERA